jgi:hypothetical protein
MMVSRIVAITSAKMKPIRETTWKPREVTSGSPQPKASYREEPIRSAAAVASGAGKCGSR